MQLNQNAKACMCIHVNSYIRTADVLHSILMASQSSVVLKIVYE